MSSRSLMEFAYFAALAILAADLFFIGRRGGYRKFSYLYAFVAIVALEFASSIPILFFRRYTGLSKQTAYNTLYYSHWILTGLETLVTVAVIYNVFSAAVSPLPGLHRISKVVFRWVAVVSTLVALAIGLGPHIAAGGVDFVTAFASAVGRIQEGVSVFMLCLLLFVCFSTKPLGLEYRSRVFGVALGLGVYATVSLLEAAWLSTNQVQNLYSPIYAYGTLGACAAFMVWGVYFALPEPEPKLILLPTTSPYHFWNRLSEALGDNPGHVALSGIKPSPVEMKIMAEMGKKSRERDAAAQAAEAAEKTELVNSPVAS